MTAGGPLRGVRLYLVASVTPDAADDAWRERVRAAVRGGVEAVQLRMKQGGTERRRAVLAALREALPASLPLLVNDDLEALFDAAGRPLADGLHLGREDAEALAPGAGPASERRAAGLAAARARLGAALALGTSTRDAAELRLALDAGADHVGFGAMAPSRTKSDTAPASLDELARLVRAHPELPVFPIGGLDAAALSRLARRGVRRAAVGAAILDAPDPERAARACRAALAAE